MIKDFYEVDIIHDSTCFTFESVGTKGTIKKWIAILSTDNKHYNLAFGDIVNNKTNDSSISGNNDAQKVLRTVIYALQVFFFNHKKAIVYFEGVDSRRMKLYNSVIQHKLEELSSIFLIEGQVKENAPFETILPTKLYTRFKIQLQPAIYLPSNFEKLPIMNDINSSYHSNNEPSAIEILGKAYTEKRIISTKLRRIAKREAKQVLATFFQSKPDGTAKAALVYTLQQLPDWCGEDYLVEISEYVVELYRASK